MENETPIKSGIKTTELGITILASIMATLISSGVLSEEPFNQIIGVLGVILPAFGYTISRGIAKAGGK